MTTLTYAAAAQADPCNAAGRLVLQIAYARDRGVSVENNAQAMLLKLPPDNSVANHWIRAFVASSMYALYNKPDLSGPAARDAFVADCEHSIGEK